MISAENIMKLIYSNGTRGGGGSPNLPQAVPNVLEKLMAGEQQKGRQHLSTQRKFNAEALEIKVSILIAGIVSTHSNVVNGPEGNISLSFNTRKEMPLNFFIWISSEAIKKQKCGRGTEDLDVLIKNSPSGLL